MILIPCARYLNVSYWFCFGHKKPFANRLLVYMHKQFVVDLSESEVFLEHLNIKWCFLREGWRKGGEKEGGLFLEGLRFGVYSIPGILT